MSEGVSGAFRPRASETLLVIQILPELRREQSWQHILEANMLRHEALLLLRFVWPSHLETLWDKGDSKHIGTL